jgi:hypothetical protein
MGNGARRNRYKDNPMDSRQVNLLCTNKIYLKYHFLFLVSISVKRLKTRFFEIAQKTTVGTKESFVSQYQIRSDL